jgi:hypothetical protein
MIQPILGILVVAAVATAGDFVWYHFGIRQTILAGVIHGAALLMSVGAALGWSARRVLTGLQMGIVAGVIGALSYYALVHATGSTTAMITAWAVVWIALAIGEGRVLQKPRRPWLDVVTRGIIAAVLSGLAFYAVSSGLWGREPAGGRNYLLQYARWIVAWAPGIITIAMPSRAAARK